MKIRTDFVTNSSSSSFCVEIKVVGKKGEKVQVTIDPADTCDWDCGNASFTVANLNTLANITSVSELGKVLTDSVVILGYSDDEDPITLKKLCEKSVDEDEDVEFVKLLGEQLTDFEKELGLAFVNTSDILCIIITRTHNAWGEFIECDGKVELLTEEVSPYINRKTDTETEWESNILDMQSGKITVETNETCCDMSYCFNGLDVEGKVFVITGKLESFNRREDFVQCIKDYGGSVVGAISKNVDYLISNDSDSTSSKTKKAKELNIPIISEAEFCEMFGWRI